MGLWTLVFMYGYGPSSLGSLLCSPTGLHTTPLGGVAGLLVPSSLLIRGAPVAPPTLPVFFSLRPPVVRATKELALRPAPPDWASACLSLRLGVRRVLPGPLLLCRRGLSSLGGLLRRSARPRLRSSGLSVVSFFLQFLPYLRRFLCPWIYEDFRVRRSLRINPPR